MTRKRNVTRVEVEAPAKINLRLVVLARETSGYHSLETIFCGISLHDTIRIEPAGSGVRLHVTGPVDPGPAEDNLAIGAGMAFYERLGVEPAIRIDLEKRIPAAAGLGGGSSDAAATLRALNALHGKPLVDDDLVDLAGALGSDVPFFLARSPFAVAWNRGDRLLELTPPVVRPLLIIVPGVAIPTPLAFARIDELREQATNGRKSVLFDQQDLSAWPTLERLAHNDFEPIVRERFPRFDTVKGWLQDSGAALVMVTGSGSAFYGIFNSAAQADAAEQLMREKGLATMRASTLQRWPDVFITPTPA